MCSAGRTFTPASPALLLSMTCAQSEELYVPLRQPADMIAVLAQQWTRSQIYSACRNLLPAPARATNFIATLSGEIEAIRRSVPDTRVANNTMFIAGDTDRCTNLVVRGHAAAQSNDQCPDVLAITEQIDCSPTCTSAVMSCSHCYNCSRHLERRTHRWRGLLAWQPVPPPHDLPTQGGSTVDTCAALSLRQGGGPDRTQACTGE